MNSESLPPAHPALDADYEILREIGRGGTALVYLARERATDTEVAIKVIRAKYIEDEEAVARFAREARFVAQLDHPNIVHIRTVVDLGNSGIALVMTHVAGRTLKQVIREEHPISPERTERMMRDVANGLGAAHAMGIVHRDVKPENIFIDADGRALLADFGLARSMTADTQLTMAGVAIGTPAYMAPEQIDGGQLDARGDIYSLGLVAWEMLTGKRPWDGESLYAVLYHQKYEQLPDLRDMRDGVPDFLADAIAGSIEKDRDARWQNISELTAVLDNRVAVRHAVPRAPVSNDTTRFARPVTPGAPDWPLVPPPVRDLAVAASGHFGAESRTEQERVEALASVFADLKAAESAAARAPRRRLLAAAGGVVALLVTVVVATALQGRSRDHVGQTEPAFSGNIAGEIGKIASGTRRSDSASNAAIDSARARLPGAGGSSTLPSSRDGAVGISLQSGAVKPIVPPRVPARAITDPTTGLAKRAAQTAAGAVAPQSPVAKGSPVAANPVTPPPANPPSNAATSSAATPAASDAPHASIVAGGTHSCLVSADGRTFCWGGNSHGQLGNGATARAGTPALIGGELRFNTMAAGLSHSCAIARGGAAWCWGENDHGQLGDRSSVARGVPARVADGHAFRSIVAGAAHSCGLDMTGVAWCWGSNAHGQLGDSTARDSNIPVRVGGGRQFTSVAAGWNFTCGIDEDAHAFCWGDDSAGELGDEATETDRRLPSPVSGGHTFMSIAAGNAHACGVTTQGEAYCWGRNSSGQLGEGTTTDRSTPIRVKTVAHFSSIAAGAVHTCAIGADGDAYCWGRNTYGQLGDGGTSDQNQPVRVTGAHAFASVRAFGSHTCGVTASGEAFCWGYNLDGELGDGTRTHRTRPVYIEPPSGK
ncbi:MAG: protein kinase [bacterium]